MLVQRNPDLPNLIGLNQLQSIGGHFGVLRNRTLTSLGDFPVLQTIGDFFGAKDNAVLTSLGNFPTLQTIGGFFLVSENYALTSLGAFPMLTSIGIGSSDEIASDLNGVSILVEGNDRLQDCCVLTAFLSGATNAVSGHVSIYNNATGCSNTTEVNCDPFLQVGQKVVFVAKTATEGTLDLFSTLRWQLSKPNTGAEWITNIAASDNNSDASSITGENYAFITITTTANPNNADRSTKLTLRAIDQAGNALTDPASITIPFTQLGATHTGNVIVRTQAQVDALLHTSLTAGTTRIMGNVTIGPEKGASDISDLSPFATITEITGNVVVQRNPDLPNLIGLNQLQSIGGHFGVLRNRTLPSLGDFPTLQSIGGRFSVSYNAALTSLGDFPVLQTIGGRFEVKRNDGLTSLGDFPALQSIGDHFVVEYNDVLISLGGFPMLASIGSDQDGVSIKVEWNKRLQDCCVLTTFLIGVTNAVSDQVFINFNAPGCSSTTQVNCNPFLKVDQKIVFIAKTATEGRLEIFFPAALAAKQAQKGGKVDHQHSSKWRQQR